MLGTIIVGILATLGISAGAWVAWHTIVPVAIILSLLVGGILLIWKGSQIKERLTQLFTVSTGVALLLLMFVFYGPAGSQMLSSTGTAPQEYETGLSNQEAFSVAPMNVDQTTPEKRGPIETTIYTGTALALIGTALLYTKSPRFKQELGELKTELMKE